MLGFYRNVIHFLIIPSVYAATTQNYQTTLNYEKFRKNNFTDMVCPPNHFKCATNECIHKSKICNDEPDCEDASDEVNCEHFKQFKCPGKLFTCENKECVRPEARCDSHPQCSDGSDEKDCPTLWPKRTTTTTEMTTTEATTKKPKKKKKKKPKKMDYLYEKYTPGPPIPDFKFSCPKPLFQCKKEDQCIFPTEICNGEKNCRDGTDELNCEGKSPKDFIGNLTKEELETFERIKENEREEKEMRKRAKKVGPHYKIHPTDPTPPPPLHACPKGLYKCENEQCIPMASRCDGVFDCKDETDEKDCENYPPRPKSFNRHRRSTTAAPPFKCPDYLFTCKNEECVAMRRRCDGTPDCADSSDEEDCDATYTFPHTTPTPSDEF